jgi:putative transposase
VHRWAVKILPVLAKVFRSRKRDVGRSWRMDETYIKVNGVWKYLYRAVDRQGDTVDFLLTAKRDLAAARRFFERAMGQHDLPESITIDKSGANTAAINSVIADTGAAILMRQCKHLNNIVEQDHRAIKRVTRPLINPPKLGAAPASAAFLSHEFMRFGPGFAGVNLGGLRQERG